MNMYTDHAASLNAVQTSTPQTEAIPGREAEMKLNNAGGFTFTLDQWGVLDRFIMIGSENGNYYVGQKDVMKQSFANTLKCIAEDGLRAVARALEYSTSGRAPKNDPALVVLALAASKGTPEVQSAAYDALPKVARTGTHLFTFVSILNSLGKWNAAAKRGLAKWYTNRSIDKLAIQVLKYQQRNGWSHRDVLRLAHVKPQNDIQTNLFKYITKGGDALVQGSPIPQLVIDFEFLKRAESAKDVVRLIESNPSIAWELVPTQFLKDPDVLMALLPSMGMTAVIRQLGKLTAAGVIKPMSEGEKLVVAKLSDAEAIKRGRVHPITILQALKQYQAGHGEKGSLVWSPVQRVVSALDDSFYSAFTLGEDKKENHFIACDISGSMTMDSAKVIGSPNLLAGEVAAVFAMAIARTQSNYFLAGFKQNLEPLKISPTMRLADALNAMRAMHWQGGSTDCAKAFEYALQNGIAVDKFTVITDNETYAGGQAPVQALKKYRDRTGRAAKSIVIATSVSEFTIADPKDGGMLDIAGFDSAAPQIIADF
jgi:60 kDa SS-A/Ro ribonucleoprotein